MPLKKKTTRRRRAVPPPIEAMPYREKKCVRITEADNGFSVSTYDRTGEKIMVAKNGAEAMRHARTLLGGGMKPGKKGR